ncbi:MAG: response regulator [Janthinobacterium lividum]
MARVLVVEDEPNMRKLIAVHLRADDHSLVAVGSLREGLLAMEGQDFDVILTDQKLPDGEGVSILQVLSQSESPASVVMLTAFGTVELALETMRKGAFDFLTKPFAAENLRAVIDRAARHTALQRENALLRSAVDTLAANRLQPWNS